MAEFHDSRGDQTIPVQHEVFVTTKFVHWSAGEIQWLRENYPLLGKLESARHLGRSVASVRYKASSMGLKLETTSEFFKEFQQRAASSKVGKKRPEQAEVLRELHRTGKLLRSPESLKRCGERHRMWLKINGHPRGTLGMKHTEATLKKLSSTSLKAWAKKTPEKIRERGQKAAETRAKSETQFNPHGKWKQAWRTIGGKTCFFRSRWEANYARYLELLKQSGKIIEWTHEPKQFVFYKAESGPISYLPDFAVSVTESNLEYHEVKGWMDDRSKASIQNMKLEYPEETLIVIDAKEYKRLAKQYAVVIEEWEYSVRRQY